MAPCKVVSLSLGGCAVWSTGFQHWCCCMVSLFKMLLSPESYLHCWPKQ